MCGDATDGAEDYVLLQVAAAPSDAVQWLGAHAGHLNGELATGSGSRSTSCDRAGSPVVGGRAPKRRHKWSIRGARLSRDLRRGHYAAGLIIYSGNLSSRPGRTLDESSQALFTVP
jgi:hypothetical protein